MPSIIIETHHAFDPEEVARWTEARTLDVFAATVASALVELWSGEQPGVTGVTTSKGVIKSNLIQ